MKLRAVLSCGVKSSAAETFFKVLDGPANKKAFKKWMTSPHHGGTIIEAWFDKVQINRGFQLNFRS